MDESQDADQRSFQRSYSQQQAARIKTKFKTQANALLRKNGMQQRRSWVGSLVVVLMPILFCALLFVLQKVINNAINTPDNRCGCYCNLCYKTVNGVEQAFNSSSPENACQPFEQCTTYNESLCGLEYSSSSQAAFCPITTPSTWPALIQAPPINLTDGTVDLATLNSTALFTGADRAVAEVLAASLFFVPNVTAEDEAAATASLVAGYAAGALNASALSQLGLVMGTTELGEDFYSLQLEPAFVNSEDYNASILNAVSSAANPNSVDSTVVLEGYLNRSTILGLAAPSVNLFTVVSQYAANASDIQDQAYCAYRDSRCAGTPAVQAWDFQDTSQTKLNLLMFYNGTSRAEEGPPAILRVNQGINRATNAFLRYALGGEEYQAWLLGLQEMPKGGSRLSIDFSSLLGPLFFCWLLQLLLPSMLNQLVYEKERRLRSIMKMHGLGDAAYWTIQYTWFFLLNFVFSWILILFGSLINLSFFRRTSYSFQFVFYWLWVNCLVSFAFLLSTLFKSAKTAVVVGFLYVFGTGLVGVLLLQTFISEAYWWVIFLELVPGWALYRGLYEIAQYAFRGNAQDRQGMSWSSLGDTNNGVPAVMAIMAVETVVFMVIAWYLEQVVDTGVGVRRHPLFFLGRFRKDKPVKQHAKVVDGGGGADEAVTVGVEAEDVRAERQRVEGLSPGASHEASIVIRDLHKTFPAPFGGIGKQAVRGLTLAIQRGECFGLLGPNGAGKSTTLNMLTGFLDPTHGTALIEGHDIRREMNTIYSLMGVCPQDNLLWERLTAREHLTFYGRLKNLRGQQLTTAVNDALRKVNLLNGGVGDKQVRRYSGGMKRRLSVAISFIGSPLVVYLDEPSTGLDPASRQNLWSVVKAAKEERAIILTTHSMEEATVLCDRLGIFVDGTLVCIGNPKELTSRYGGYLVFTITTPLEQEAAAHALVTRMSPGARLTYALAGTRKYELPVQEVTLPGVFETMEAAKAELRVLDWGVANATLEEVFIKFAKSLGVAGG